MRTVVVLAVLVLVVTSGARAAGIGVTGTNRVLCDMATSDAERETGVPDELLTAISRVETGRRDPDSGTVRSWPWTIDVEGTGHFYDTKEEAVAAVRAFQAAGARSIDVGCMQVNLLQHPDAFGSLSDAFDPRSNALWAARFLTGLFRQTGSWPHAAAAYHSMTPDIGAGYQDQVLRMWAVGDGPPDSSSGRAGRRSVSASPSAASPSLAAPTGGLAAAAPPFGADRAPVIATRYGGGVGGGRSGGNGRGLDFYRAMPVAMANRPLVETRWRGS